MSSSSFDQREQIRDAIDIVDLVSRYVPLRRQGRNYVGRCPWHDDSRPSLQVNPERQTFKCWVCNIGGDIFSFMMQMEGVDFREALEILADMAGISLEPVKKTQRLFFRNPTSSSGDLTKTHFLSPTSGQKPSVSSSGSSASAASSSSNKFEPVEITKSVLYRSMDWLAEQYHQLFLHDPEAEAARQYIGQRGINDEMIERFKIGYSPVQSRWLLERLGNDRNRVRILETAGVLVPRKSFSASHTSPRVGDSGFSSKNPRQPSKNLSEFEASQYYDRFFGRVLFPIRDTQERTVAFGGRILPNAPGQNPAKYLNSPETPIFTKSKMLYGLNIARNSIRKTKRVIITEGYTDCLMAHQFDFGETVAVLGTALGSEHIKILKRFADKMILLLDGDTAGRKRTEEVLGLFMAQGVDLEILTLPDDNDPCEYLLEFGKDALEDLLQHQTLNAMDHAFRVWTEGIDLDKDIIGSAKALDRLLNVVALFPISASIQTDDPVRLRIEKTIQRLALRFRIPESEVRIRINELRRKFQSQQRQRDPHVAVPPRHPNTLGTSARSNFSRFPAQSTHAQSTPTQSSPVQSFPAQSSSSPSSNANISSSKPSPSAESNVRTKAIRRPSDNLLSNGTNESASTIGITGATEATGTPGAVGAIEAKEAIGASGAIGSATTVNTESTMPKSASLESSLDEETPWDSIPDEILSPFPPVGSLERSQSASPFDTTRAERSSVPPSPPDSRVESSEQNFYDTLVYPLPEDADETDEQLRNQFAAFPKDLWEQSLMTPSQLERDYLEVCLTVPELFSAFESETLETVIRSPITRQLYLLAKDLNAKKRVPTLNHFLLRYLDENMKMFLIDIDESIQAKNLNERLNDPSEKDRLLYEICLGFERQKIFLDQPKKIEALREEELNDDEKLQKLLELQQLFQKKQQSRIGSTGFTEENGPTDDANSL